MAKRNSKKKQPAAAAAAAAETGALERQVLAFAEQLGYVAGSIQSKTEGLVDRDTMSRQIAGVRDGAKHLLNQLASGVTSRVRRRKVAPAPPVRKARSGGTVDAPGKKHRKPAPAGPPASAARARNTRVIASAPSRAANHRPRQG